MTPRRKTGNNRRVPLASRQCCVLFWPTLAKPNTVRENLFDPR
jgi:hypothetical protein